MVPDLYFAVLWCRHIVKKYAEAGEGADIENEKLQRYSDVRKHNTAN